MRFALARVVQQHPHYSRDPIDLADDDAKFYARVRRRCLVILERFGAHAYHAHRSADLVRETGGQRANRREAVRAL